MVYWNQYDVYNALIGGFLMGITTSLHLVIKGRITGFSGIFFSIFTYEKKSFFWKSGLMISLAIVSAILFKCYGWNKPIIFENASPVFDPPDIMLANLGMIGFALAGFLVGFGTKMGNGCTSGHGICGLPRLAPRSIVAVGCFMGFGVLTASIKQFITLDYYWTVDANFIDNHDTGISTGVLVSLCILLLLAFIGQFKTDKAHCSDILIGTIVGAIFGLGLVISGMVKRSKIYGFLTINDEWDPSLMFVMFSAVTFNFVSFNLIIKKVQKPLLGEKLEIPTNRIIDWKLITGASIFGIGWGVGDLCPGPAIALLPVFSVEISIVFLICLGLGQVASKYFDAYLIKRDQEKLKESENNKNENSNLNQKLTVQS